MSDKCSNNKENLEAQYIGNACLGLGEFKPYKEL